MLLAFGNTEEGTAEACCLCTGRHAYAIVCSQCSGYFAACGWTQRLEVLVVVLVSTRACQVDSSSPQMLDFWIQKELARQGDTVRLRSCCFHWLSVSHKAGMHPTISQLSLPMVRWILNLAEVAWL